MAQVSAKDNKLEELTLRDEKMQTRIQQLLFELEATSENLDRSVGEAKDQKLRCDDLSRLLELQQQELESLKAKNELH